MLFLSLLSQIGGKEEDAADVVHALVAGKGMVKERIPGPEAPFHMGILQVLGILSVRRRLQGKPVAHGPDGAVQKGLLPGVPVQPQHGEGNVRHVAGAHVGRADFPVGIDADGEGAVFPLAGRHPAPEPHGGVQVFLFPGNLREEAEAPQLRRGQVGVPKLAVQQIEAAVLRLLEEALFAPEHGLLQIPLLLGEFVQLQVCLLYTSTIQSLRYWVQR